MAVMSHITLAKMSPQDDQVELFKHGAEAWGWPYSQCVVHLLLLLSGEAQLMAQQLLLSNLLEYPDLKRVILKWVIYNPKQQRQCFQTPASSLLASHSHLPNSSETPAEGACWQRSAVPEKQFTLWCW